MLGATTPISLAKVDQEASIEVCESTKVPSRSKRKPSIWLSLVGRFQPFDFSPKRACLALLLLVFVGHTKLQ